MRISFAEQDVDSGAFTQQGEDKVFVRGTRTYLVHAVEQRPAGLRISLTVREGDQLLARDILSPGSQRARARFAAKLNGHAEQIETELIGIDERLRAHLAAQAQDARSESLTGDPSAPWPDMVHGDVLLHDLLRAVRRFVVLPKYADVAAVLWVVAAHSLDAWDVFPLLAATSPTKRCGKTTFLDILRVFLPRPLLASNVSPAAIYRAIEAWHPSLLVDEADTFLTGNDELRGVLNSSHARTAAYVLRVEGEGEERTVTAFSTWCAKAIALIGSLPPTLEDRSIVLRLRRKTKADRVDRARRRSVEGLQDLRRKAARWAEDNGASLERADPVIPDDLDDRAADNWQPLLAVADLAGGPWPELARKAAVALSAGRDVDDDEAAIRLLRHIQEVFNRRSATSLPSVELVSGLLADEEWGWGMWRKGRPLDQRGLARLLGPFGVSPRVIRIGEKTPRGYEKEQFLDAWAHYLAPDPQQAQQISENNNLGPIFEPQHGVPVADGKSHVTIEDHRNVADVADKNPGKAPEVLL